jgi:hypothetical protein
MKYNKVCKVRIKESSLVQVNPNFQQLNDAGELEVILKLHCEEAKMDK